MKNLLNKIYVLAFVLFFMACENLEVVVPIDVEDPDPVLAVGAYFSNNMDSYNIAVSQAVGALSDLENTNQDSALIQIFEEGLLFDEFILNRFALEDFEQDFVPGNNYRLQVSKSGFETISAEAVYPSLVEIDTAYFRENNVVGEFDEELKQVQINFQDPVGSNFYEIKAYIFYEFDSETYLYPLYPSNDQFNGQRGRGEGLFFSDENFEGELAEIIINYSDFEVEEDAEVILELRHITEDYLLFDLSLELAFNSNDNPFSEPVQVKSNIENGFGVFALWNSDIVVLEN